MLGLAMSPSAASAATVVKSQTSSFSFTYSKNTPALGGPPTLVSSATSASFAAPDTSIGTLTGAYFEMTSHLGFTYAIVGYHQDLTFQRILLPRFGPVGASISLPQLSVDLTCRNDTLCITSGSLDQEYDLAFQALDLGNLTLTPGFGSYSYHPSPGRDELLDVLTLGSLETVNWNGELRLTYIYEAAVGGGVPEPGTWAMLIMGFGVAGGAMRRRGWYAMRRSVVPA